MAPAIIQILHLKHNLVTIKNASELLDSETFYGSGDVEIPAEKNVEKPKYPYGRCLSIESIYNSSHLQIKSVQIVLHDTQTDIKLIRKMEDLVICIWPHYLNSVFKNL